MKKIAFLSLCIMAVTLLVGFDKGQQGTDSLVLSIDQPTLMKLLGVTFVVLLAEIWRNQRAIFKMNTSMKAEIAAIKGFCAGKNGECGIPDESDRS